MSARFPAHERRYLCTWPGIGDLVVSRIEQVGVGSLRQLQQRGVDEVLDRICQAQGQTAWRNRRKALLRALSSSGLFS